MTRYITTFILVLSLGACTDAQLAKFTHTLDNFTAAVHSVDSAIAAVNQTLYNNCTSIYAIGTSAQSFSKTCSKASNVISGVNSAIDSYCQTSQVTDIATAVKASADAYSAYKSGLADAKASCGG